MKFIADYVLNWIKDIDLILRPNDSASADGKLRNEVEFPVRSGPKQFTAYLKGHSNSVVIFFLFMNTTVICMKSSIFKEYFYVFFKKTPKSWNPCDSFVVLVRKY